MRTYKQYKDSGIEWIGEIPEHWILDKFSRVSFFQEGPGLRQWQFTDDGVKVICVTNIVPPKIDFSIYRKHISKEEYESSYRHFTVNNGDILIASSGASWGKVSEYLDDEVVILNTSTIRLNTNQSETLIKGFIKWLIQCAYISEHLTLLLTGSCQPNFGPSHLKQLFCVYPKNKKEQTAIANYLNIKTAEIDQTIADKEALINLFEEEKKALINEAVTKGLPAEAAAKAGLNPKVPLKPSGIDWLGDIPEHWEVKKLKYLLKSTKGALKPGPFGSDLKTSDYLLEGNIKVYTQRNVLDNDFEKGDDFISDEKFEALKVFEVMPNDILVTTRGSIGKTAVFPKNATKGIIHPCLIKIQIDNIKVLNEWLIIYFNESSYFEENVHLESNSTIIDVIYGYTLNNIIIPIPPLEEQTTIVQYIETETKEINEKINLIKQEVELLKEYRQGFNI